MSENMKICYVMQYFEKLCRVILKWGIEETKSLMI